MQISLHVPKGFVVPQTYISGDLEKVALALTLGAQAISYMENHATDALRDASHRDAIKEATQEYERLAVATSTKLKRAEEAARAANMRIEAMEAEAASLRSQIQKEVSGSFESVLKTKDQQIAQAQGALERAMETVSKKVESLQNSMTKTYASSKDKGTLGEMIMEEHLKKAYDCDVSVVSKEPQSADIRMTRVNGAYLWEVKNYTRMVTKDEVEKFRRDLRLHPDVRGGILVSLRHGIVGKCRGGDIDLEFLEDGRFIVYINTFLAQEDPVFYLQTLRPFFELIEANAKPVKEDAESVRALEMKAALMTNLLRSHSTSVTKHKNAIVGHKKRTDTMFAEFQSYIFEAEAQLHTILKVAMGDDGTSAEVQAESTQKIPTKIFKRECLGDFPDDRVRAFIKWFLTQVDVQEGSQIDIKDVVDRAKLESFSDKFIRGLREEVFEDAAWPKGARSMIGLRWISV